MIKECVDCPAALVCLTHYSKHLLLCKECRRWRVTWYPGDKRQYTMLDKGGDEIEVFEGPSFAPEKRPYQCFLWKNLAPWLCEECIDKDAYAGLVML